MRKFFLIFLFLLSPSLCLAQSLSYEDAVKSRIDGDYENAEKILLELIEKDPENAELWFQLGLVQRFEGKLQDAAISQEQALKISPDNSDAKLELARIHFFKQDYTNAQSEVDEVLQHDPNYLEAKELSARIKKAKLELSDYRKFQLDLGHELSRFSRKDNNDWRENFAQFGFRLSKETLTHARFNEVNRFNKYNRNYELGIDHRFGRNYNFGFDVGHTPNSTFLPSWRLKARGEARVIRDHKFIGDTWILVDAQKDRYQGFDVFVFKNGVSYFVTKNLELKGLFINVIDQNDHNISGWTSRLDWQTPLSKLRLYSGISVAPETQNGIVVNTEGKFLGGAFELKKDLFLNVAYAREDRENSFIRKVFNTSLSVRF